MNKEEAKNNMLSTQFAQTQAQNAALPREYNQTGMFMGEYGG